MYVTKINVRKHKLYRVSQIYLRGFSLILYFSNTRVPVRTVPERRGFR